MATAVSPSHSLASERSSIESTYELTKYLEYQLKEIKDVYLTYLGPPFNEKDFSPPRPNSTALTLPSAATRLELWHGLENQARLAQNQRAYSVLLAAVRELARSTLCPSLRTSLLHFCTGLDGLLGSISALMTTLGYALPPQSANMRSHAGELQQRVAGGNRPAPLMSAHRYRSGTRTDSGQRSGQRRSGTKVVRGEREEGAELTERRRGRSGGSRERGRGERGRRDKRDEPERRRAAEEEELQPGEQMERWGRRLMSILEEEEERMKVRVSYLSSLQQPAGSTQYSYTLNAHHPDTFRAEDGLVLETAGGAMAEEEEQTDASSSSSSSSAHYQQLRPPRSLPPPTLQPPLSTFSLLYQIGGEEHTLLPQPVPLSLRRGTSLLSPPLNPLFPSSSSSSSSLSSSLPSSSSSLLSVRPTMNDFARKVEGFWILRELQSWLWRSAKDFNRLKKRLRG